MTHDHNLDKVLLCVRCINEVANQRDRLLTFVNYIANQDYGDNYKEAANDAIDLLKELGFENE